jgi:hypothetical protein
MDNEKIVQISETLLNEEEAENVLIALYLALLDAGVEKCIDENQRNDFRMKLNTLYEDSITHKQIIQGLLHKHKKE